MAITQQGLGTSPRQSGRPIRSHHRRNQSFSAEYCSSGVRRRTLPFQLAIALRVWAVWSHTLIPSTSRAKPAGSFW